MFIYLGFSVYSALLEFFLNILLKYLKCKTLTQQFVPNYDKNEKRRCFYISRNCKAILTSNGKLCVAETLHQIYCHLNEHSNYDLPTTNEMKIKHKTFVFATSFNLTYCALSVIFKFSRLPKKSQMSIIDVSTKFKRNFF